jgi:hypothetical protein
MVVLNTDHRAEKNKNDKPQAKCKSATAMLDHQHQSRGAGLEQYIKSKICTFVVYRCTLILAVVLRKTMVLAHYYMIRKLRYKLPDGT